MGPIQPSLHVSVGRPTSAAGAPNDLKQGGPTESWAPSKVAAPAPKVTYPSGLQLAQHQDGVAFQALMPIGLLPVQISLQRGQDGALKALMQNHRNPQEPVSVAAQAGSDGRIYMQLDPKGTTLAVFDPNTHEFGLTTGFTQREPGTMVRDHAQMIAPDGTKTSLFNQVFTQQGVSYTRVTEGPNGQLEGARSNGRDEEPVHVQGNAATGYSVGADPGSLRGMFQKSWLGQQMDQRTRLTPFSAMGAGLTSMFPGVAHFMHPATTMERLNVAVLQNDQKVAQEIMQQIQLERLTGVADRARIMLGNPQIRDLMGTAGEIRRAGIQPNMHEGQTDLNPQQRQEWYLGQLVALAERSQTDRLPNYREVALQQLEHAVAVGPGKLQPGSSLLRIGMDQRYARERALESFERKMTGQGFIAVSSPDFKQLHANDWLQGFVGREAALTWQGQDGRWNEHHGVIVQDQTGFGLQGQAGRSALRPGEANGLCVRETSPLGRSAFEQANLGEGFLSMTGALDQKMTPSLENCAGRTARVLVGNPTTHQFEAFEGVVQQPSDGAFSLVGRDGQIRPLRADTLAGFFVQDTSAVSPSAHKAGCLQGGLREYPGPMQLEEMLGKRVSVLQANLETSRYEVVQGVVVDPRVDGNAMYSVRSADGRETLLNFNQTRQLFYQS